MKALGSLLLHILKHAYQLQQFFSSTLYLMLKELKRVTYALMLCLWSAVVTKTSGKLCLDRNWTETIWLYVKATWLPQCRLCIISAHFSQCSLPFASVFCLRDPECLVKILLRCSLGGSTVVISVTWNRWLQDSSMAPFNNTTFNQLS